MKLLIRRYVCDEQRKRDDFGVTEDDVMEIRQDISTLKYELIDIFRKNGMQTPNVSKDDASVAGKKGKMMERRILKDFQIGIVEGIISESLQQVKEPKDVFSTIANVIKKRASSKMKKEDWNAVVRKGTIKADPIGSKSEALKRQASRQSLRRAIIEAGNSGMSSSTEKLVEINPQLAEVSHGTRVAYAKFMTSKYKKEIRFNEVEVMDEATRAKELKAFNRFKEKAGILKKRAESNPKPSTSSEQETDTKNFRSRTPIEEDPREGLQTPDRPSTPDAGKVIDPPSKSTTPEPKKTTTPEPSKSPSPQPTKESTPEPPKVSTAEPPKAKTPEPPKISTPEPPSPSTTPEPSDKSSRKDSSSSKLDVPKASTSRSSSPTPSFSAAASDKGKSKISGKTLTGWI
jgi:transient receptor potential cation channel subfamily C member 4